MKKTDLTEKILEDYNDIFADIVNVLVLEGEELIAPEDLENTKVHSQYKAEEGVLHEQERDIAKVWRKNGVKIAICGIENQNSIDRQMPLRIFGYEGASYREQYGKENVIPIITLVLYFGEEHWKKNKELREMLNIPKHFENLVNDIHINVYEISWLTESQLSKFKSDFGIVARFVVEKRKNKNYIPQDKRKMKHVDEVLKLLTVMTNDKRYEQLLQTRKGEITNMCEVAERLEQQGVAQGIERGIEQGIEQVIHNMHSSGFTIAQIIMATKMDEEGILKVLKKSE